MRILVTGATGFIGRHIVRRLEQEGHEVTCAGRSRTRLEQLLPGRRHAVVDFNQVRHADDWKPCLRGVDAVVNAVGLIHEGRGGRFEQIHTKAACSLFEACLACGVKRVVQISALGADEHATTRYHLSKRAADQCLAALDPHREAMRWTVLRPSIVYGPGSQSTALFAALAALPLVPRLGKGTDQVQPVHIDDLAEAVARVIASDKPLPGFIEVVGPAPVTSDQLLSAFRRWLGFGPAPRLSIPASLLQLAGRLGALLGSGPVNPETVRMLRRGNTADPEPMIRAIGVRPVDLEAGLARTPAEQKDRWHARLYFLRLPLRVSLALLWIATGLLSFGIYPAADSYALLARAGFHGDILPGVLLYGAAAWDLVLGAALLAGWRVPLVGLLQILTMLVFTAIITITLPGEWLHPFGAITKNIPLIAATLIMMALEDE